MPCTEKRARLLLASRDKQVLEQLAASYRAREKQVEERRDQREMDDVGARRARLAATTREKRTRCAASAANSWVIKWLLPLIMVKVWVTCPVLLIMRSILL